MLLSFARLSTHTHPNDRKKNLRSRGAKGHQGEICDGVVPILFLVNLLLAVRRHDLALQANIIIMLELTYVTVCLDTDVSQ